LNQEAGGARDDEAAGGPIQAAYGSVCVDAALEVLTGSYVRSRDCGGRNEASLGSMLTGIWLGSMS
jgi:hypothetical protein